MNIPENKTLVLFDGYCHLCSRTVQFILKHDTKKHFSFASLQSQIGQQIRNKHQIPAEIDSVILIDKGKIGIYAEAAFMIIQRLGGLWRLLLVFRIIPRLWADKIYRWIARNRFKWFGKRETCFLPSTDYSDRFL